MKSVSRPGGAVALREGVGGALALSAGTVVLAILGLAPGLRGIPELALLGAAALLPVGVCGGSGYRAAGRDGHVPAGSIAGAIAGAAGGAVSGLCYLIFGKSALDVGVGLLLGLAGGAAIGTADAVLALVTGPALLRTPPRR